MGENEIKVSVIMPVYKVEQYVARAIESIQAQTLQEFEFLIVDDGTPDRSGEICDAYAAKDSRIHVFHKENGGAPSARNMAIDIAKGKYMYFMDSDDWAEPTMLEDLYTLAEQNSAQLVVSGFYIDTYYSDTEFYTQDQKLPARIFGSQQEFREYAYEMFDQNLLYPPWNKLFLSEYLIRNNLKFPNTFMDDFPFVLSVIRDVERVVLTDRQYYHFIRARAESETAKYRANLYEKREEEHSWMLDLYDHWGVHDEKSEEMLQRRYIERVIGCVENVTCPDCNLPAKEKKAKIREMIRSERARTAVRIAKPRSAYMKLMLVPIRSGNVGLTYLEGKVISGVKSKDTKLFAKLKAGR